MSDSAHERRLELARLATRLLTGEPTTLSAADAADLAQELEAQMDVGAAWRADLAVKQGMPIVCARGCNACCEEPIVVFAPEALAVARWLDAPAQAELKRWFQDSYARWHAAATNEPAQLAALASDADQRDAYEAEHRRQWRERRMCAFNRDGDCAIYPVRPLVCRDGHAVDTAERCVAGSPIPARRLTFGPMTQFLERAMRIVHAAHAAAGEPPDRYEALCDAVAARLLGDVQPT